MPRSWGAAAAVAVPPTLLPFHPPPPLPLLQEVTWALKQGYPGRILTAEITPEDPHLMAQYGFDAIWVHSGAGDVGCAVPGVLCGVCCVNGRLRGPAFAAAQACPVLVVTPFDPGCEFEAPVLDRTCLSHLETSKFQLPLPTATHSRRLL